MKRLFAALGLLLLMSDTAKAWETVKKGIDPENCTYRLRFILDTNLPRTPNGSGIYYLYQRTAAIDGSAGDTAIHFPYLDTRDKADFPNEDPNSLLYRYPFAAVLPEDFQNQLSELIESGYNHFPGTPSRYSFHNQIEAGSSRFILSERWTGELKLEFAVNATREEYSLKYDENDGIEPNDLLTFDDLQDVIYLDSERTRFLARTDVDLSKVELQALCRNSFTPPAPPTSDDTNAELKAAVDSLNQVVANLQDTNGKLAEQISSLAVSAENNARELKKLKRRKR